MEVRPSYRFTLAFPPYEPYKTENNGKFGNLGEGIDQ